MCGRLTQSLTAEALAALFEAIAVVDYDGGRFNVAPTQPLLVVVADAGQRVIDTYRWGLIPSWAKDMEIGQKMINARAETVREKPSFRAPFKRQRCIVPADAFYEWQRAETTKVPHAIRRTDGKPLAFAGLWSSWYNRQTDVTIRSAAIITTEANELMQSIHDRMPVILTEETWEHWLDPEFDDGDALQGLLQPCPSEWLEAYPVSRAVNSVRNDGPELLAPV